LKARALLAAAALLALPAAAARAAASAKPHKLLVLSVDGLDWRYIRDADRMGLKIPNIRKLLPRSAYADGVIGVWPTITWPSHTAIITGARPDQHGILSNARGTLDPTLSYWAASKLKVETLWQCAGAAGRTTAAVTWPVTMNAAITYNLPEVFVRRNGGSMDLDTVAQYATPGLVADITRAYPSFPQQWVDDRTRTQATLFLLKHRQPDLILTHLVDLDSEEHDQGPFATNAYAIMERTDELVGDMLKALPETYDFALVSDHGFERIERITNLSVQMKAAGVQGDLQPMGGIVVTRDAAVAAWLRRESGKAGGDVGREIPHDELVRYAPKLADTLAAFEPADHVMFGRSDRDVPHETPPEKGDHGFWPLRHDYRSVFLLSGPGVTPANLGPLEMISLEPRLAAPLGLSCSGPR
jgi:predicted AlkP superfamily pyrophosphatase or phosphodiesterase